MKGGEGWGGGAVCKIMTCETNTLVQNTRLVYIRTRARSMNISYWMLRCTIFSDVYMNILYCVESGKLDDHRAPTYCTTHICSSLHFNRLCSRVVIPLTSSSLHSRGNSADKLERENTQPKSDVLFPSRNDAFLFLCLFSKQGNDLYVWIGALIIPSRTVNTGGSVHSCESPS